jgi:hypothetical protein
MRLHTATAVWAETVYGLNVARPPRLVAFDAMVRRVADRFGAAAAKRWAATVLKYQKQLNLRTLEAALRTGRVKEIERVLRVARLQEQLSSTLARGFDATQQAVGREAAQALTRHGITIQFNAARPGMALAAREQAARLVKGLDTDTRLVISDIIAMGAERGLTIDEQARAIREVVGLPPNWARTPQNLAEDIIAGRTGAATGRYLSAKDKQQIRSRIKAGTNTVTFAREMAGRYAESLINWRARNIARTESLEAAHRGLMDSWDQAIEAGSLSPESRRFLIVTPDERLCPFCMRALSMNPNGRGMKEPFATPRGPKMIPPFHPSCRCSCGLVIRPGKLRTTPQAPRRRLGVPLGRAVRAPTLEPPPPRRPTLELVPDDTLTTGVIQTREQAWKVAKLAADDAGITMDRIAVLHETPKVVTLGEGLEGIRLGEFDGQRIRVWTAGRRVEEVRETIAHEATHLRYELAARADKTLEKDIIADWKALSRDDGVTGYSESHWTAVTKRLEAGARDLSRLDLLVPVQETLAEMRAVEVTNGILPGTRRYKKLLERVEQGYRKAIAKGLAPRPKPITFRVAENPKDMDRVMRSRNNYKAGDRIKQRFAEGEQARVAKILKMENTPDNDPFDLLGKRIGVEVKTLVDANNDKITVQAHARGLKLAFARKHKLKKIFTLAIDTRSGGRIYYIREGVGAFRLRNMQRVSLAEVKRILVKAGAKSAAKRPLYRLAIDNPFPKHALERAAEKAIPKVKLPSNSLQRAAVNEYRRTSETIARLLRKGEAKTVAAKKAIQETVKHLDAAIRAQAGLKKPVVVWRGFDSRFAPQIGTVFTDKSFTSTSFSQQIGEKFANQMRNKDVATIMRIGVRKGQKGLFVDGIPKSEFELGGLDLGEHEYILPRRSRFRIIGAKEYTREEYLRAFPKRPEPAQGDGGFESWTALKLKKIVVYDVEVVK